MNFNLRLVQLVEPERPWQIVTSVAHSTVWDGKQTLFEFNFLALGISADDCFMMACVDYLPPGKEQRVGHPVPFKRAACGCGTGADARQPQTGKGEPRS